MNKYKHHTYKWTHQFIATKHEWSFIGPYGGIHFHVSIMDDQEKYPDPSCGLEFHSFKGDGAPDHLDCWLTKGHCWHDGTSLYASDTVWPMVKQMIPAHQSIFQYLESIVDDHWELKDESMGD